MVHEYIIDFLDSKKVSESGEINEKVKEELIKKLIATCAKTIADEADFAEYHNHTEGDKNKANRRLQRGDELRLYAKLIAEIKL